MKQKKAQEKNLELRFIKEIKKMGGEALKFYSVFNTGWPDRFILMPGGFFYMAEIKSEGKDLLPKQKARIKKARKLGFTVFEIVDEKSYKKALKELIEYKKFFNHEI